MSEVVSLANPYLKDIGPSLDREVQPLMRNLPDGTVVVSADTHWEVNENIFVEAFPDGLKDQAPHVWFDKYWHMGFPGQAEAIRLNEIAERAAVRSFTPGIADMEVRLRHMDAEGIDHEIVYPQSLLFFIGHKDRAIQELIWRAYNEYIARKSAESDGRFIGVGMFSNWWDPARADAAMQQIVDLGLKTFMIPVHPGTTLDGREIFYGDVPMDRFWSVAAEAGLPVGFHVTENFVPGPRGGLGSTITNSFNHFRKPLGQMIFGGVFDRHPDLKVVFAEGGLSWVPVALQDAEMVFDSYGNGDLLDPIKERPTTYWQNNCYATFQTDQFGLDNLEYIGADNVMWSNDYPHSEGAFGLARMAMESILDATTGEQARNILGGTAIELYGLGKA